MARKRPSPAPRRRERSNQVSPAQPPATEASADAPLPHGSERLQKFLANAGIGSRRACEELILEGRVTVDGVPVRELGVTVRPEEQEIRFDGEVIEPQRKVYWWLNKPPGVLSTSHDPQHRKTVLDLVPKLGQRVYAVGRLDEESTGLMLLTNDGEVAEKLTHPRYQVPKTYECLIAGKISADTITKLKEGVWLSDGKARVKQIERIGVVGQASRVRVVLCEGHNREIRRLFAKFGHKVMKLTRTGIGPLRIRKLRVGQARPATPEEVEILRSLAHRVARGRRVTPKSTGDAPTKRAAKQPPEKTKPRTTQRGKPKAGFTKATTSRSIKPKGKRRPKPKR